MGLKEDTDNINSFIDPKLSSFAALANTDIGDKVKLVGCKGKRLAAKASQKLIYEGKRAALELLLKFVLAAGPGFFKDCCDAVSEGKTYPYEIQSFPPPVGDGSKEVVPCRTIQDCSSVFARFNTKMFNELKAALQKLAEEHVKALQEIEDAYNKCIAAATAQAQAGTQQQ